MNDALVHTGWGARLAWSSCIGGVFLAMGMGLSGPSPLGAWQEGGRIGYVNVQAASNQSQSIQRLIQQAGDNLQERQQEIDRLLQQYESAKENLAARRSVLSAQGLRQEEKKLEQMELGIDRKRLDVRYQLRRHETEIVNPSVERILKTIGMVAEREGFTLVLRSDVLAYGTKTLDLTALVVEELDREPQPSAALPPN